MSELTPEVVILLGSTGEVEVWSMGVPVEPDDVLTILDRAAARVLRYRDRVNCGPFSGLN